MNPVSFAFAFNNKIFSNRIINLKIIPQDHHHSPLHCLSFYEEEHAQNTDDGEYINTTNVSGCEKRSFAKMCNSCVRSEDSVSIYVNEVILAAHSEYFFTLFTNGMRETANGSTVEISISSEEEVPVMALLYFMHTGRLPSHAISNIVKLLFMADRFRVPSCFQPCIQALSCLPRTLNDSLLLLSLPDSIKTNSVFSPLMDHCQVFIGNLFQPLNQKKTQFLNLPLVAASAVLAFDDLNVKSEEEVFMAALEWTEANCNTLKEQISAMEELSPVIRFPWMEGNFLVDVIFPEPRMQGRIARELVLEALRFKSLSHWRRQELVANGSNNPRFRVRNAHIQTNLAEGGTKTYVEKNAEPNLCTVYFEFPLGLVMCGNEISRSKHFSPDGVHGFYIEALQASLPGFNERYTCHIRIVHANCPFLLSNPSPEPASEDGSRGNVLEYVVSRKVKALEEYERDVSGSVNLTRSVFGPLVSINSLFEQWWGRHSPISSNRPSWDASFVEMVYVRAKFKIK